MAAAVEGTRVWCARFLSVGKLVPVLQYPRREEIVLIHCRAREAGIILQA